MNDNRNNLNIIKEKRCPNGTRKNRKTGLCEPIKEKNKILNVPKILKSVLKIKPILPNANLPNADLPNANLPKVSIPPSNLTPLLKETIATESKEHKKRCPNGTRKNRKTGLCEPIKKKNKKTKKIVIVQNFKNEQPTVLSNNNISTNSLNNVTPPEIEQESSYQTNESIKEQVDSIKEPVEPMRPVESEDSIKEQVEPMKPVEPEDSIKEPVEPLKPVEPEDSIKEPVEPMRPVEPEDSIKEPVEPMRPVEPEESIEKTPQNIEELTKLNLKNPINTNDFINELENQSLKKNTNDLQNFKELFEYKLNQQSENNEYPFLYPELNDPNFNTKIAKRKEFNDFRYDGEIYDIKKHSDILCHAEFELSPHQIFVKNFLSLQTPYNSLLLYHGLGTGKTCSAIGIAEENRKYMKQIGLKKRIIVIASPNVQDNFRLQLFNETKLKLKNGIWNIQSCVGNALINEINPTQLSGMSKEKLVTSIKTIINTYYVFMGYIEFSNYASKKINDIPAIVTKDKERQRYRVKNIKKTFNNRLIIVDEVHNIRLVDDNKNKSTAKFLFQIAEHSDNLRLLLLSATPMYNSYREIIWLTNLLNINDKRSQIKITDVFDKNGQFKETNTSSSITDNNTNHWKENGKSLLIRKLTGYVSYVRSENPYSFPYRVYKTQPDILPNPLYQINETQIKTQIQYIPIYYTNTGEIQEKAYLMIVDFLKKESFLFHNENVEIQSNTITPPINNEIPPSLKPLYIKQPSLPSLPSSPSIVSNTNITPTESQNQYLVNEGLDAFGYEKLQIPVQGLNIIYPNKIIETGKIESKEQISLIVGKKGLDEIMDYQDNSTFTKQPEKFNYNYKAGVLAKYGRIFHRDNLYKYSGKIAKICDIIRKSSKGIIMIYSQYIDGGIVPISLALEEMGITRYGSANYTKSLFQTPPTEQVDSYTMKTRSELKTTSPSAPFHPAKYTIISGDIVFSPTNEEDIKYITREENKYGEHVKIVIISKAGAEGLDFRNIRQIHIMESWYNMNRIEQIIGRGVRNLSHCSLPFEERNVEIFLHSSVLPNRPQEECADTYIYRTAETKAIQIGAITRILKETSVDCMLNIGQTNFSVEKLNALVQNQNIKIRISSEGGNEIDYIIGDKPYTDMCDYMNNCEYKCHVPPDVKVIDFNDPEFVTDKSTFGLEFISDNNAKIIERIRGLFKERPFYTRKNLIESLNSQKVYPLEQIYSSLTYLIKNKNEYLIDKYERLGNLVNKGDIYSFQPIEITDENISIYERNTPIEYKRNELIVQVPTEFKEDDVMLNTKPTLLQSATEPPNIVENKDAENLTTINETVISRKKDRVTQIINNIESEYITLISPNIDNIETIPEKKRTTAMNIRIIRDHLYQTFGISYENTVKYAIDKLLDSLNLKEKLLILNEMYLQRTATNEQSKLSLIYPELNTLIYEYFKERQLGEKLTFLLTDEQNTIAIYSQNSNMENDGEIWVQQYNTKPFLEQLKRFVVPIERISQIFGFIEKGVFKIRDKNNKRNKGFDLLQSGKQRSTEILNYFVGLFNQYQSRFKDKMNIQEPVQLYTPENTNNIKQGGICAIVEILLRFFKEKTKDMLTKEAPIPFLTEEEISIIRKYIV